jgi:Kef-type K+ transport system membrane component KefB
MVGRFPDFPGFITVPSLPLEEPVIVFTIALATFLVGPLLIERLGLPGIVGIVLIGAILGPGGVNLVAHSDAIVLLGTVGLIYLLFTVGLELDLRRFLEEPENAAMFGIMSFGIPFVVGSAAVIVLLGLDVLAGLLLAAVFASHTLLAYPIVNQYGITRNRAVTAVFGGILFTDTLALLVLALVRAAVGAGGLTVPVAAMKVLTLLVLVGGIWVVVPPVARWFFRTFSEESYFEFLFVALIFFLAASIAELLEIAPLLGAFVGGLALNRLVPEAGTLMRRIEFVGNALFIPFFLLHVGMLVDFSVVFSGAQTLLIAGVIIGVMVVLKWIAAWLVSRVQGYTPEERGVIFGLSIGQAAAALAITLIGYDLGVFDRSILNAVVLMLLVTAVASPWMTKRAGRELALKTEAAPAIDIPIVPRLLLPVTHAGDRQRRLLELAFLLRAGSTEHPVHLLTVVSPDGEEATDDAVQHGRSNLDDLAVLGSDAAVPDENEVRVKRTPGSGIVNWALETQAARILLGWSQTQTLSSRMFGDLIGRVLQQTTLPVHVARLDHPISTTKDLFIVLPSGIDHHEGFFESIHYIKKLAAALGVTPTVLAVEGSAHQYERLFDLVEPEATPEFRTLASWRELHLLLAEEAEETDLVSVIAARRGDIGWDEALSTLPQRLIELPPDSFLLMYPRKEDPEYDRRFLRFE